MAKKESKLKQLGSKKTEYVNDPKDCVLETFDNTAGDIIIPFVCNEFTSLCPKTGQPDFAKFEIVYIPDKKCVESKALKLYLFAFRNHGDFHEDVTHRIMNDLIKALNPKFIRVFGDFYVRGGISIKPLDIYFRKDQRPSDVAKIESKMAMWDRLRHFDYTT